MKDNPPNNHISGNPAYEGRAGVGLTPESANMQTICNAVLHITDGIVRFENSNDDGNWKLVIADNPKAKIHAQLLASAFAVPTPEALEPTARLAAAINRLATIYDRDFPRNKNGVPSRMESLWLIQHHPEQSIER